MGVYGRVYEGYTRGIRGVYEGYTRGIRGVYKGYTRGIRGYTHTTVNSVKASFLQYWLHRRENVIRHHALNGTLTFLLWGLPFLAVTFMGFLTWVSFVGFLLYSCVKRYEACGW